MLNTTTEIPAAVTAAADHMNAWEAEGRRLHAEAEALYGDERDGALYHLQSRNWGDPDAAGALGAWWPRGTDAVEFCVGGESADWKVAYNDQTREWEAVYSPEEGEWENRDETSLASYPLSREDRERLQEARDALYEEGNSLYLVEKAGEIGILVYGEDEPREKARLQ